MGTVHFRDLFFFLGSLGSGCLVCCEEAWLSWWRYYKKPNGPPYFLVVCFLCKHKTMPFNVWFGIRDVVSFFYITHGFGTCLRASWLILGAQSHRVHLRRVQLKQSKIPYGLTPKELKALKRSQTWDIRWEQSKSLIRVSSLDHRTGQSLEIKTLSPYLFEVVCTYCKNACCRLTFQHLTCCVFPMAELGFLFEGLWTNIQISSELIMEYVLSYIF